METKVITVIYAPKANKSILRIIAYIENKGYPETAEKFSDKLYDFGNSLVLFPEKYQICRNLQLAKRKMRCAVFHKNYIIVYKTLKNNLVIYNVIHIKTNPVFFSA